ncbi:MAG: efflux transporter outer membrane subunit [Simkania sp.]|nr:efflux transporter outer membrane subunit [Simkania sp.]
MKRQWIFCIGALVVQSCTLHPKYSRPNMPIPSEWRIPTDSSDLADLCWWKQFGDPVLDHLIDEALLHNQDLKVAIHTVDEYIAKLGIARSYLYPQLNGTASGEREKTSVNAQPLLPGQSTIGNAYTLLLNASYQVDIWGEFRSATEVALANLLSQIETRRTVVLTLVSAVATSYIQLRQYDKQLVIANETLDSRNQSFALAKTRYELGLTSDMEVQQAQAEQEFAQVEIDRLEIAVALEEDLLSVLIGKAPTSIQRGKILDEIIVPPSVPMDLPSALLNQRPDILAAEQNLIAANAQIGVAKAQFFPQINLTSFYGTESSALNNLFTKPSSVWQYGANLLQEIFTGGYLTSNLRLTEAQKMALLHQYEATILNAFKEVNDAMIAHKITTQLVEVLRERVATLAEYFHLATLRYEDGLTDYLTYLDAERQLFTAQLDYAQAQGDNFVALIDIYKALGGGWVTEADTYAEKSEETPSASELPTRLDSGY